MRRAGLTPGPNLVQANGSYLPFADESFDAVFHYGGVNLFSEPELALREFARVARRGGIVAWGDEGFAPELPPGWRRRAAAWLNPGFERPRLQAPATVQVVAEHTVFGGFAYLTVAKKLAPDMG